MTDLISRQDAIDIVEFECGEWIGLARTIIKRLDALPSAEPHWIPCSERLPEVRQWVLCQCRAGIMDVLRLTADGSWEKTYPHIEYMSGFVVAWMPLPEAYKG